MILNIARRTALKALGVAALLGLTTGSASGERTQSSQGPEDLFSTNATDRFTVTVDGTEVGGWTRVQVPGDETQEVEYREGTDPDHQRKTLGQTVYGDFELERPVQPDDTSVFEWRKLIRQGKVEEARKTVVVTLEDEAGDPQIRWEFTNAWVKEYGSVELSSGDFGDTATESVTVAYDEVRRTHPS